MKRATLTFVAIVLALVACSRQSDLEGTWKNGDGNLIRFEGGGKAWLSQEGLSGEGECSWTRSGDSIVVTSIPSNDDPSWNTYRMFLVGDTLHFVSIGLHPREGEVYELPIEEFALRSGKPLYKLSFTRIGEDG